jgi:two-component system, OmpR family, phosphate regulon sensor histidine kinase PhoR
VGDALSELLVSLPDSAALDEIAHHWSSILQARVTIIAADGEVLGESHEERLAMDNHLMRPEIQQALQTGRGVSVRFSRTTASNMMYTAVPVLVDGQITGFARLALSVNEIEAGVAQIQQTFIGTALLIALLAGGLAVMIANRVSYPLRSLSQAARDLTATGTAQGIIPYTNDEVGQLARAFNQRTQQLQSQMEALRSESLKLEAVLDEMSDGVLIVDARGQVQLINPAARRMFDLPDEQPAGRSLAETLRQHQLIEIWKESLRTGQTQEVYLEFGTGRMAVQAHASPLGSALPGSTLLLCQDLTNLRRLETVRRDFISNLSHELRTPLASLKALAETLQETVPDDPLASRRFLQQMEQEVDALAQMVSELLELSRIESGIVLMHFRSTSPEEIIMPAVDRMRLQAERAGLVMEVDLPAGLPPVLADPPRLEQVLVNLLHNAIKYTQSGGRISATAAAFEDIVIFSVSDTGAGIPPENIDRIFERFYKVERSRAQGGAGLGLAIARHIVEAHGGRIWAESEQGRGSTFFFSLPRFAN